MPSGVKVIGERVFAENHDIVSVDLNEVTEVKDYAFFFCKNLKFVTAKKVKIIGFSAFRADWIEKIDLHDVEIIEDYAFFGCLMLKEIGSTPNLTYIGDSALGSTGLERIEVNKNATRIGTSAFSCSKLVEFDYPDGIEEVEGCAFASCHRLRRITLPKSLKKISTAAFWYCDDLRRVEIPENVTDIAYDAFKGCCVAEVYNKSHLNIHAGKPKPGGFVSEFAVNVFSPTDGTDTHDEIDGYVFCTDSHDQSRTFLIDYLGNEKNLVLPRDYHGRGYGIFRETFAERDIESIDLGDGVTEIDHLAFYKCENLKSVKFGSGLKYIYRLAFKCCKNLIEADLGDSVELLGSGVFLYTDIGYIKFGPCMKEIRNHVVGYCRKFKRVYYTGTPEQFESIKMPKSYREFFNSLVRFYSETEKPDCWHYVDGKIEEY